MHHIFKTFCNLTAIEIKFSKGVDMVSICLSKFAHVPLHLLMSCCPLSSIRRQDETRLGGNLTQTGVGYKIKSFYTHSEIDR